MKNYRKFIRWSIFASCCIILFTIIAAWLPRYLEKAITKEIVAANGTVSSVQVELFARSLFISKLRWSERADSLHPYPSSIQTKSVNLKGIHLLTLLFKKKIVVNKIILDSGFIDVNTNFKRAGNHKSKKPLFAAIKIKQFSLNNITTQLRLDTTTYFTGIFTCILKGVDLQLDSAKQKPTRIKSADVVIANIVLHHPEGMYHGTIKQIKFQSKRGSVQIDSVLLIPSFGKYAFAHVEGKQVGRINLSIPAIAIDGLHWENLQTGAIQISMISIPGFDLYAFRDRRVPFPSTKIKAMPMASFGSFRIPVQVDSVKVNDARIRIEEFPLGSTTSGTVTFDHVGALLTGLNNRLQANQPRYAILTATGLLMSQGPVKAEFQFPLDGSENYHAKGSLDRMDLTALNPVLENMVDLRIKSGNLNSLTFNFNYNDYTSKGSLNLAYENLIVTSLNKNKSSTNELKTILIKVFMKRDQIKATPLSERMGVIDIKRDRTKFIFNLWWKSVHDGLKSSMAENTKRKKM